jgi:uncharacterized protein (TIGR00369 family)
MALAPDEPLPGDPSDAGGTMPPALLDLPGHERLAYFVDGSAPLSGIQLLTGVRPVYAGGDGAVFRMSVSDDVLDDLARVPIGVLATLADGALGWAVTAALPPGGACATVGLNLAVVRPAEPGATLTAESKLVSYDGRTAMSDVRITDGSGATVARGGARLAVFLQVSVGEVANPAPGFDPLVGERRDVDMRGAALRGPVHDLFGLDLVRIDEGAAQLSMRADKRIEQTMGSVQGGALSLFAERAMVCAAGTTLPAESAVYLADLHMQFARPQRANGEMLFARAKVRHRGRRLAFTSVTLTNSSGSVLAFGSGAAAIAARDSLPA